MTEEKMTAEQITLLPDDENTDITESTDISDENELGRAIDSILFAAGYPVEYGRLAAIFARDRRDMKRLVRSHALKFNELGLGIMILTFDETVQMCTREDYKDFIRQALGIKMSGKLSNSSLEVLAVVAYHQPCTKMLIEKVRGVDCSYAISSLCDKGLIESKDRLDVPGRPMLYSTTDAFLRCFGLDNLSQLPSVTTTCAESREDSAESAKQFELRD